VYSSLLCETDIKSRKLSDEMIDRELSSRTAQQSTSSRQASFPDFPRNVVFDLYDFTGRMVGTHWHSTYSCNVNSSVHL